MFTEYECLDNFNAYKSQMENSNKSPITINQALNIEVNETYKMIIFNIINKLTVTKFVRCSLFLSN